MLAWALGTCLAFGRGSDSYLGAIGMGFAACVLFLLQGYSGIKKWVPPFVGVWVSWFGELLHAVVCTIPGTSLTLNVVCICTYLYFGGGQWHYSAGLY